MNHPLSASRLLSALFLLMAACLAATTGSPLRSAAAPPPPPHMLTPPLEESPFRVTGPSVTMPSDGLLPDDLTATSKIVFQSYRDNNWEIYVARGNGGYPVRLTYDAAPDLAPRLSPAALQVAFTSRRTGTYEIFVANVNGSNLRQVTPNGGDDAGAAWSFDGTRFVYESYVNGQWDVFVINVDGSNPQRLTNSPDYDGTAAWSPDGTKIAFTSRRSGELGVWVMNADGSGQTRLSTQPSAENPAWSPDGTRIAYDADSDDDTWHEIWVMNANGSNPRRLYRPEDEKTDAWVGSWSPDGRYIAFMYISWIEYEGQWYWTSSRLRALDSVQFWAPPTGLGSGVRDWRPDWQGLDLTAPTSSVLPLPSQSPYAFTVRWSGSDQGRSGILNYVVQVKDNDNGWNVWQDRVTATSAVFIGDGGHVYSFRSQANDRAENTEDWPTMPDAITTVEALAPVTSVDPLPVYRRNGSVISWSGTDPGGSGIHTYDVQYQLLSHSDESLSPDAWTNWLVGTTSPATLFTGIPGRTYAFRSRGLDRAHNQEEWPPGNGDASTTMYTWAIIGTVKDNRGVPIVNATITTMPRAFRGFVSDENGRFQTYVDETNPLYAVSWNKADYGVLPTTNYNSFRDVTLEAILPPPDQSMGNGSFEAQNLAPWQTSTELPAALASQQHIGEKAALLGCSPLQLSAPHRISANSANPAYPSMEMDSSGVLHVVWMESANSISEVSYVQRRPDGSWSTVTNVSNTPGSALQLQMALDHHGGTHVVWTEAANNRVTIYYKARSPAGVWGATENALLAANLPDASSPQLAVAPNGTIHLVWFSSTTTYNDAFYAYRGTDGGWSAVQNISQTYGSGHEMKIALAANGSLHVAWNDTGESGYFSVYYRQRRSDGQWLPVQKVSTNSMSHAHPFDMSVDFETTVHLVWAQSGGNLIYTKRWVNQDWLPPVAITNATVMSYPAIVADRSGVAHVVWPSSNNGVFRVYYMRQDGANSWTTPVAISESQPVDYFPIGITQDQQDHLHVIWLGSFADTLHLYYVRQDDEGAWAAPLAASPGNYDVREHVLRIDSSGAANLVWSDSLQNDLFYTGAPLATQTGNATLSQTVTVPVTMTTATLSFFYKLGATAPAGDRWLSVTANDGINTTTIFSTTNPAAEWTHRWFGPLPWTGKTVTLSFNLHETAGRPCAWAYLDDVSLGSAYPDLWLSLAGPASTTPGATLIYTMTYGNRGGATAAGVTISDTLPAGLTFIRANPPPNAGTPALTWNLGNLAARSGPFTIMIEARVPPTATTGSLINLATAATITPEIERDNNTATTTTALTSKAFLPIYVRTRR
ncbi:MAG: hypothetical protein WAU95_06975 [Anaerolineae bacterium]